MTNYPSYRSPRPDSERQQADGATTSGVREPALKIGPPAEPATSEFDLTEFEQPVPDASSHPFNHRGPRPPISEPKQSDQSRGAPSPPRPHGLQIPPVVCSPFWTLGSLGLGGVWTSAQPAMTALLALTVGAGGLLLIGLALHLWALVAVYSAGTQVVIVCVVMVFAGSVAWSLSRFVQLYIRLSETPAISLKALDVLHKREEIQRDADAPSADKKRQARAAIKQFLKDYPLDESGAARGYFDEAEIRTLSTATMHLGNLDGGTTEEFLDNYQNRFQAILDKTAQRRISHHAKIVGIKTALAPKAFLDTATVASHAFQLISELCRIYNVRAQGRGTVLILLHVLGNMTLASRAEEMLEGISENIKETLTDSMAVSDGLADAMGTILGQALGKVTEVIAPKAAEGMGNALLMHRLGKLAMRSLQPVRP